MQMAFLVGISKCHMAVAICGQDTGSGSRGGVGPALVAVMPRARKLCSPTPGPKLSDTSPGADTALSLHWAPRPAFLDFAGYRLGARTSR